MNLQSQLSRTCNLLLALSLAIGATAQDATAADAGRPGEVDLIGTWHVLVHFTDKNTQDIHQLRWDDRVWIFEPSGSRLRWTEYPIVVFADDTGRFEALGGNKASRVLHAWEPNPGQLSQIQSGLEVNPRGSKSKTLQRSDGDWISASRNSSAGISVVSYQETWTIEDSQKLPVFRREESLGSAGDGDEPDGVTLYTTTEVQALGDRLTGTFERDDNRRGTFIMTRSGAIGHVKGSGKSQGERFREAAQKNWSNAALNELTADVSPATPDDSESEPIFPNKGLNLTEVLAALHAAPAGHYSSTLRKLEILRLRSDGFEQIPYDDIKSGALKPKDEDDYGVIALVFCRTANGKGEYTSWYLLDANSLAAWDHYRYLDDCANFNHYEPSILDNVSLENRVTNRARESFPRQQDHTMNLYTRGLALVRVGRVQAAEQMLAQGDKNLDVEDDDFTSSHGAIRSKLANKSDRDSMRARLVAAIAAANRAEDAVSKPAPRE